VAWSATVGTLRGEPTQDEEVPSDPVCVSRGSERIGQMMSTLLVLGVLSVFRGNFPKSLKDISERVVFVVRQCSIDVCIVL
jgi:hypothetical protein